MRHQGDDSRHQSTTRPLFDTPQPHRTEDNCRRKAVVGGPVCDWHSSIRSRYRRLPQGDCGVFAAAFAELSKAKLERGKNLPARLCIVFEEAHSLIPEWNQVAQPSDTNQVNRTARTILQGRKYGMGALIITQRTANVTKTILNQCNTIFALQSFDQTGLDFLRNYMGEEYSHAISTLPTRHAILVGKASSSTRPLLFSVTDLADRWKDPPIAETVEAIPANPPGASA